MAALAAARDFLIERAGHRFLCVVAHAPTAMAPVDAIVAWWAHLTASRAEARREGDLVVMLLDANSRVGSTTSFAAGPVAAEKESASGFCLHELLLHLGLALPPTLEHCAVAGPQWTWLSPPMDRAQDRLCGLR